MVEAAETTVSMEAGNGAGAAMDKVEDNGAEQECQEAGVITLAPVTTAGALLEARVAVVMVTVAQEEEAGAVSMEEVEVVTGNRPVPSKASPHSK